MIIAVALMALVALGSLGLSAYVIRETKLERERLADRIQAPEARAIAAMQAVTIPDNRPPELFEQTEYPTLDEPSVLDGTLDLSTVN